ncbi:MAG TPA: HNH endonuclease [Anaerolineae bacterium]|nr:HNH endonuclease [Anaerolineae bacterium]
MTKARPIDPEEIAPHANRFWEKVDTDDESGCWLWVAAKKKGGYGVFRISKRVYTASRLAWVYANNIDVPPTLKVMHLCDNPACCRPDHLTVGTQHSNMTDMRMKGRATYVNGEAHGGTSLTAKQVIAMRREYAQGNMTQRELAEKHGIPKGTLASILAGDNWKRVGGPIVKRGNKAEAHHSAKLTADQVLEIRERYAAGGIRYKELSKKYGVNIAMIGNIVRGLAWRHADGPIKGVDY